MTTLPFKYLLPFFVMTILFGATAASAQITNDNTCLTIGEALQRSATRAPDFQIASARVGEASADVTEAKSLFRPRISGFGRSGAGDTGIVDSGVSNQVGARASQRIFDFGDAKYARIAARSELESREYEADQASNSAIVQTALSILQLQQISAQQALTETRREFFARQYEATNNLLEVGGATLTDVANIASRLAETDAFYLELEFIKERAQTEIETDTESPIPLCEHKIDIANLVPNSFDLFSSKTAVTEGVNNNLALKALDKRVENLDAQKERQKRNRLPVIEVVGTSSYSSFDGFGDFDFTNRVGVDVSVPFVGGTLKSDSKRASARLNLSRAERSRAEKELEERIKITLKRISSLQAQIPQFKIIEEQMFIQFEAAQTEETIGTKTLSDIIDIRLQYEEAGLRRINGEFELQREKLALLEMTGVLQKTYAPIE